MSETYEVTLIGSDNTGVRGHIFLAEAGWTMDRLDNGVVALFNKQTGSLIEYSPYAWQSVQTENIDMTEATHD